MAVSRSLARGLPTRRNAWRLLEIGLTVRGAEASLAGSVHRPDVWLLPTELLEPELPMGLEAAGGPAGHRALRLAAWRVLEALGRPEDHDPPVLVGYHGTTAAAAAAIVADRAVRPSDLGLLGPGVYLAPFRKAAARYALLDRDYRPRARGDAWVIRCLVWAPPGAVEVRGGSLAWAPDSAPGCGCGDCARRRREPFERERLLAQVADHRGEAWARRGRPVTLLWPCAAWDPPRGRPGAKLRWVVRNWELCVRPEHALVCGGLPVAWRRGDPPPPPARIYDPGRLQAQAFLEPELRRYGPAGADGPAGVDGAAGADGVPGQHSVGVVDGAVAPERG